MSQIELAPPVAPDWHRWRQGLFNGWGNGLVTLGTFVTILWLLLPFLRWAVIDAVWTGSSHRLQQDRSLLGRSRSISAACRHSPAHAPRHRWQSSRHEHHQHPIGDQPDGGDLADAVAERQ